MAEVSVIIPVYNTAPYLAEAVGSIMGQSLRDIEIIIVDDGSTDGSSQILSDMAAADDRIKLYRQENRGQSAARNEALAHATGRYVYFMDSDDVLERDALELCLAKCNAEELDVVFFDADNLNDADNNWWFDYHRASKFDDRVYGGVEIMNLMFDRDGYKASPCIYMVRRELLLEHNLNFYVGIVHEDELFTAQMYLVARRVGRIDRAFFKRRMRQGSTMGVAFSTRNKRGYLTVLGELKSLKTRCDAGQRVAIDRLISQIVNPLAYNAWALPLGERCGLMLRIAWEYPHNIRVKSLAVLMFKSVVKSVRRLWAD